MLANETMTTAELEVLVEPLKSNPVIQAYVRQMAAASPTRPSISAGASASGSGLVLGDQAEVLAEAEQARALTALLKLIAEHRLFGMIFPSGLPTVQESPKVEYVDAEIEVPASNLGDISQKCFQQFLGAKLVSHDFLKNVPQKVNLGAAVLIKQLLSLPCVSTLLSPIVFSDGISSEAKEQITALQERVRPKANLESKMINLASLRRTTVGSEMERDQQVKNTPLNLAKKLRAIAFLPVTSVDDIKKILDVLVKMEFQHTHFYTEIQRCLAIKNKDMVLWLSAVTNQMGDYKANPEVSDLYSLPVILPEEVAALSAQIRGGARLNGMSVLEALLQQHLAVFRKKPVQVANLDALRLSSENKAALTSQMRLILGQYQSLNALSLAMLERGGEPAVNEYISEAIQRLLLLSDVGIRPSDHQGFVEIDLFSYLAGRDIKKVGGKIASIVSGQASVEKKKFFGRASEIVDTRVNIFKYINECTLEGEHLFKLLADHLDKTVRSALVGQDNDFRAFTQLLFYHYREKLTPAVMNRDVMKFLVERTTTNTESELDQQKQGVWLFTLLAEGSVAAGEIVADIYNGKKSEAGLNPDPSLGDMVKRMFPSQANAYLTLTRDMWTFVEALDKKQNKSVVEVWAIKYFEEKVNALGLGRALQPSVDPQAPKLAPPPSIFNRGSLPENGESASSSDVLPPPPPSSNQSVMFPSKSRRETVEDAQRAFLAKEGVLPKGEEVDVLLSPEEQQKIASHRRGKSVSNKKIK